MDLTTLEKELSSSATASASAPTLPVEISDPLDVRSAPGDSFAIVRHAAETKHKPHRLLPIILIACALGFVGIGIIAWQVVIRIEDKDGKKGVLNDPKKTEPPNVTTAPPAYVPVTMGEKEARKLQEEWAAKLKLPVEATNKLGMKLILIPPAGAGADEGVLPGEVRGDARRVGKGDGV